ncbi:MAG: hypothetical protein ACI88G_001720, partial [Woeseiaceae bacterium]
RCAILRGAFYGFSVEAKTRSVPSLPSNCVDVFVIFISGTRSIFTQFF